MPKSNVHEFNGFPLSFEVDRGLVRNVMDITNAKTEGKFRYGSSFLAFDTHAEATEGTIKNRASAITCEVSTEDFFADNPSSAATKTVKAAGII